MTDKLTHVHDRIYCCRSGSAADTQAVADAVHQHLQMLTYELLYTCCVIRAKAVPRQQFGHPPSVSIAANVFQKICYENKDQLSAGIIVAGWDKEDGPSVYNIPLGGGLFRQPWAIGGMSPWYIIQTHAYALHRLRLNVCLRLLRCYIQGWLG